MITHRSCADSLASSMREIQAQQDRRRRLKRDLKAGCGSGKEGRAIAKQKLNVHKKKVGMAFKGGSDTESVDSDYEDYQESLVADIIQCEMNIVDLEDQKNHQKKLLKDTMN